MGEEAYGGRVSKLDESWARIHCWAGRALAGIIGRLIVLSITRVAWLARGRVLIRKLWRVWKYEERAVFVDRADLRVRYNLYDSNGNKDSSSHAARARI